MYSGASERTTERQRRAHHVNDGREARMVDEREETVPVAVLRQIMSNRRRDVRIAFVLGLISGAGLTLLLRAII
jgi:hypothetical protein